MGRGVSQSASDTPGQQTNHPSSLRLGWDGIVNRSREGSGRMLPPGVYSIHQAVSTLMRVRAYLVGHSFIGPGCSDAFVVDLLVKTGGRGCLVPFGCKTASPVYVGPVVWNSRYSPEFWDISMFTRPRTLHIRISGGLPPIVLYLWELFGMTSIVIHNSALQ